MNKYFYILLSLALSCKKINPAPDEFIDREFWYDAAVVTQIDFISKSGGDLFFDMHVVTMKNAETNFAYPFSAFKSTSGFSLSTSVYPDSIRHNELNLNQPFQTIVLIDETTSDWNSYSDGTFIDALNRLNKLTKVENNQYFGIGFFARDEINGNSPVHFFKNTNTQSLFEHSEYDIMEFISENYMQLGAAYSSSIYDAMNLAVDELINNPLSNNQSVTVLVASFDDGLSLVNSSDLILKCKNNNIKINFLLQSVPSYTYFRMALETGGFVMDNSGTSISGNHLFETETTTFHLHDLLAKNYKEYIIRCRANRLSTWATGYQFNAYLEMNYYEEINSDYFEDDLYDDLEINHKLPISVIVQ